MTDRSPHAHWLDYFEARHGRELDVPTATPFEERPGRKAVARSLARFELGESGDGERLRRLAAQTGDAAYSRAIELFVAEEEQHARWLGILRERFGGQRLTYHWSDSAFVVLRHLGGLRHGGVSRSGFEAEVRRSTRRLARVLRSPEPSAALAS